MLSSICFSKEGFVTRLLSLVGLETVKYAKYVLTQCVYTLVKSTIFLQCIYPK